MRNYKASSVDDYIISATRQSQELLRELRNVIRSAVPEATEGISWGVPFYKYHGLLAGFAALKNHADFGLAFPISDKDRELLAGKGYDTGKKTVKIRFDQKVPAATIKKILKEKAVANKAAKP